MPETNTTQLLQKQDLVNLAVLNDTLYPRKAAVTAEIDEKVAAQISAIYKPAGSVDSIDDLPALTEENCGKVVDVAKDFTTTEDFLHGAGRELSAGTNVAVVAGEAEGEYKYDALSGAVDLTPYAKTSAVAEDMAKKVDKLEGMGLSSNDYTDAEKSKLAGIEVASSADVMDAVKAALGITSGESGDEEAGTEEP